jgi:hypothetical protein
MKIKTFVTVISFIFLTSCASIVSKSQYPVTIMSNPDQAEITIKEMKTGKEIYKGKTPTTLTLSAGGFYRMRSYIITFQKSGYEPQNTLLRSTLDGWYCGNLIFGGLLGLLVVDPITGAMWRLPPEISVNLNKKTVLNNLEKNTLHIVLLDDIPDDIRTKLIKIY